MSDYEFCPYCAEPYGERSRVQTCQTCHRTVWHNSSPCAGAMILREGRLLLVKRGVEPFRGWWDIPGGFLQPGEHPAEGAAREALEETGLRVAIGDLVGTYVDVYGEERRYTLNMYYMAGVVDGEPRACDDAVAIEWFSLEELPEKVAFANCRQAISDLRRRLRSGD
jgi:8-oxo-dGTP diphosphatase